MFDTLAILGTGLLGCSVLRAARARGLVRRCYAWDVRPENAMACEANGWVDAVFPDSIAAIREADLVVIATPADTVGVLAAHIAPFLKPGAIVTDVGSTKGAAVREAQAAMPEGRHFVGAHPMAGSEKNGPTASSPELFTGRACFVTPLAGRSNPEAVATVARFWGALGARVVLKDPDEHDEIVAHLSHLPHALAVVLALTLEAKPGDWSYHAGGGLRDTTRIAGGDPEIWRAIFMENRRELVVALDAAEARLKALRAALVAGDEDALRAQLVTARDWRARMV